MFRRALCLALFATAAACGGSPKPLPPPALAPTAPTAAPAPAPPPAPANPAEAPLPLWSQITKGVLGNGLTYYILPAPKPAHRAFLWLAVNTGSNLEDKDQHGLAHFDEHMAFNGTARFPHGAIVDYIQSVGMRFGADLNAYTNYDETVFQLEVPTDKPGVLDKGIDIVRDWAGSATYDAKEVDSERGVVREEWRQRSGAGQRLRDKQFAVLFEGTPYTRSTIGELDTIDHAPRDVLYRFYKDWYRPDNMAVIVVGDVDPAALSKEITAKFGDLVNPAHERPRAHAGLPPMTGTRVSIETDKEATATDVSVYNLVPTRSRASRGDARRLVMEELYATLLDERYAVLARKPDAPFVRAGAGAQPLVREIDGFIRTAEAKNGQAEEALRALLVEVARVDAHGFTQTELDRARARLTRQFELVANTAPTRESPSYAEEIVRNFLDREFMIGGVAESKLDLELLPTITLPELNSLAQSYGGANNRVIAIAAPEGTKLPTEQRVRQIVDEVAKTDVPAWEDKAVATSLLTAAQVPKPGKVTKEKTIAALGVTEWTLSNGVHVVLKPTDFEADAVSLQGSAPGGLAEGKDKDFETDRFADAVVSLGGAGAFDAEDLTKVLAGKAVRVTATIATTTEQLSGTAATKDLEAMFQLAYLRMTAPRKDPAQVDIWKKAVAEQLGNLAHDPSFTFLVKASDELYKHNPRKQPPTPADVASVDLDKAFAFYQDRFGDATDFTFVLVGAFDPAAVKPLVETYLGSLPAHGRKEKEKDDGVRKVKGVDEKEWHAGEAPRAVVRFDYHGDEAWTRDRDRDMYVLGSILSNRLRDDLREDKGGVYGVGASGTITRPGHEERSFQINFTCDPQRVKELMTAVTADIAKLQAGPITPEELDRTREIFTRERETAMKTNAFWVGHLTSAYRFGDDPTIVLDPSGMLKRIDAKLVQAAAKHYLDAHEVFEGVLLPDAAAPPPAAPADKK
jgi:zinc protease